MHFCSLSQTFVCYCRYNKNQAYNRKIFKIRYRYLMHKNQGLIGETFES